MNIFSRKYLSKEELQTISDAIGEVEKTTSGEIRVVARHQRHRNEKAMSLHDLALHEFYQLGMDKTRDRTGVLILLLFSERKFHIVADEGIHTKVDEGTWENLAARMSVHFKEGKYCDGIVHAVREAGLLLAKFFPRQSGDVNELSNNVVEE